MQIKTITFQRVKNLGNYESKRLELSAELNDDDDFKQVALDLMNEVEQLLGIVHPVNQFDSKPVNLVNARTDDDDDEDFIDEVEQANSVW